MPFDDVRGVSRKAGDEERLAVKDRVARLELPEGMGVILRTNALDQPQKTLNRDLNALLRLWKKIRQEATVGKGPRLLYSDQDLIVQALRDSLDSSIEEVLVDDAEAFAKARGYMRTFMPRGGNRLVRYSDRMPLFSRFEIEDQIDRIYQRKVELVSGGTIVIEGTEALTAIDVNSGRATRGGSQEETAFATNIEAAREVARQLRMRDIGGLVVVDFIDMRSPKHRREVEKILRDALKDDKARTFITRISENGLLEINRQRLKKALQLRTHRPCPTCSGTGTIASPELVGLNMLRRIETRAVTGSLGGVRIELHPELADALQNERRQELAALESEFHIHIEIVAAAGLHRSEERIDWRPRREMEGARTGPAVSAADLAEGIARGSKAPAPATPPEPAAAPPAAGQDENGKASSGAGKPRRRSRGGRKHKKSASTTAGEAATSPTESIKPPAQPEGAGVPEGAAETSKTTDQTPKKSSRRRRGGRKHKKQPAADKTGGAQASATQEPAGNAAADVKGEQSGSSQPAGPSRRRRPRRSRKKAATTDKPAEGNSLTDAPPSEPDPFAY